MLAQAGKGMWTGCREGRARWVLLTRLAGLQYQLDLVRDDRALVVIPGNAAANVSTEERLKNTDLHVTAGSGSETVDRKALMAVEDAEPFPPLPASIEGNLSMKIVLPGNEGLYNGAYGRVPARSDSLRHQAF